MSQTISKSQTLECLRQVEKSKMSIVITHYGKPVSKIVPHSSSDIDESLLLRDSVISYKRPLSPVGDGDWGVM